MKLPCVYILANKKYGTIYTRVASDLIKRVFEHKHDLVAGFSKRYSCKNLVFYEIHATMESAILREKALKGSSRKRKIGLIHHQNILWADLYNTLF
jgi:putative endonuclease